MCIIDTNRNPKANLPVTLTIGDGRSRVIKFCIVIFTFCIFNLLTGCVREDDLNRAETYARQSQQYYRQAAEEYKNLIAQGKDLNRLHLQLGRLYFNHGDFDLAIEALKKSNIAQAKKFLAIAYYRTGNFTDALEVFNKQEISDAEYLYYQGLTCEKLNLFDKALEVYKNIGDAQFASKAKVRIEKIEKQSGIFRIEDKDPQIYRILASAPAQEEYPQAGALILLCDEKVEITPEDTRVVYLHYLVKILNERGKESFSEAHIDYDSTFEKVELEYARAIKPNGEVVDVGSRHIRDVSRYLNFPLYSNARAYIISFPEITEGASIEYRLKIYRNQLINKKDFVLGYPLQSSEPIIRADFNVTTPKDKPLHIKILNKKYNHFGARLKPVVEQKEDRLIYRWKFRDIPQIIPESNMPPQAQVNPAILISTFNSWQDVYNWWWGLSKDKIKADSAIKEKVNQLIRDQSSEEAKVRAIYNFCAKEIRYVAVEYGQAGYEPHTAELIFQNKYGDCKDQSVLLVTMLREAQFLAWPVLIATKGYYNLNEDFPATLFNHCIAAVQLKDKIIFLDPTAETCSFGDLPADDQSRKVLLFKEDGYQIDNIPLDPAEKNLISQHFKIRLDNNENIAAEKSVSTHGIYDQAQRFWLLYTPPKLIEESLKEKIQEVSIGATLDKYNIKNLHNPNETVVLSYVFRGPEYFVKAGRLRIMPQLTGIDTSTVAKDKRQYPIDFGILDSKELIFEIEFSPNFVIKYMPDTVIEDNPWFKFIAEYKYSPNKIYFRQNSEVKKNSVSETEYPDFKKSFEELAKRIKQRIVLERVK